MTDWRKIDDVALNHEILQRLGWRFGYDNTPDYADDLNAAWALFQALPHRFTPRLVRMLQPLNGVMVTVHKAVILDNETHEQFENEFWDPAPARALAWHF